MESPEEIDWFFMNPVIAGMISYSDLKNGTVNLYDLYIMNESLDYETKVKEEQIRKVKRERALKVKK